jgi:GNAT superfamily N-acetyltransferase
MARRRAGWSAHPGWLYIELMWLPEALRGQGLGSALLADAEAEALERGCAHAHLDVYSFQAEGFFRARGYREFGALASYPPGHVRRFLEKALTP